MTDLRARLTAALRDHRDPLASPVADWRCEKCMAVSLQEEHLADVLLSLDGIAIVELPKPVVGQDWDWCAVLPGGHIDDLITESGLLTTDEARSKAAALLAAAQAAERATE